MILTTLIELLITGIFGFSYGVITATIVTDNYDIERRHLSVLFCTFAFPMIQLLIKMLIQLYIINK